MKRKVSFADIELVHLYGQHDTNLRLLQDSYEANVTARGGEIVIEGEQSEVEQIETIITEMAYPLCSAIGWMAPPSRHSNGSVVGSPEAFNPQPRGIGTPFCRAK